MELQKRRFSGKYLQIRYEDFVKDPKMMLKKILRLVNEEKHSLEFIEEDGITFRKNHCVFGNPDLFKRGKVELKLDERWKNISAKDKLLSTFLSWPLLVRYGYPLFPKNQNSPNILDYFFENIYR